MIGEIEKLILNGTIHGIMFYSLKKDSFIVGADVNMIYTITGKSCVLEFQRFIFFHNRQSKSQRGFQTWTSIDPKN